MKPTRWNSARANKKWLAFTTTVTVLLLGCWIHSLFFHCVFHALIGSKTYLLGTVSSSVGILVLDTTDPVPAKATVYKRNPFFPDQGLREHLKALLPLPRARLSTDAISIIFPFWLILLGFLGLQWALLPKSLPPPKIEPHPAPPDAP